MVKNARARFQAFCALYARGKVFGALGPVYIGDITQNYLKSVNKEQNWNSPFNLEEPCIQYVTEDFIQ